MKDISAHIKHIFGNFRTAPSVSLMALLFFFVAPLSAQTEEIKQVQKDAKEAAVYLSDGAQAMQKEQFVEGEASYRKAISIEEKKTTGNYNLGNAYYQSNKNDEALSRFAKAATTAATKPERHQAFHNLGNSLMNKKDYAGAVEAYKNALRNNPTDDESRYNLALAKDLLEKNPPQGGGDDDNKDQDQDQKDDQDKQDQKDQENQDKKDGDDKEDQENEDKGDQEDKDKKGDQEDDKGKPDEPKDPKDEQGKGDQQEQQPTPGKLSPQEVKNLLESMNNEEKKVQDKINAKKQKGVKVKSEKDW